MRILHRGIEKARELIAARASDELYRRGIDVVEEARDAADTEAGGWLGFTGQSKAAFGVGVRQGGNFRAWQASEHGAYVIREKVPKGETVHLDSPYEGNPRSVRGAFDIMYDDVGDGFRAVFGCAAEPGVLCWARFAYPIEYMNWLNGSGAGTPLGLMHVLARLALMGLQRGM